MTDMTAFERQLSGEISGLMGPVRPVDDLAIYESVVAANRQKGWGFTMFSAVKFVVASVIVALFGGFLLAGMFTTQQGDEVLPAAVTESPSPMTTEGLLPGVTLTVEGIGPGVYRVINDGVRDLMSVEAVDIVAGYDGGIWLLREDEFLRLGSDGSHGWPMGSGPEDHIFEVAPDGTMWVIPGPYPVSPLNRGAGQHSTDGEEWTVQPCPAEYCAGFTVAPDGTVWASWREHFTVSDPPLGPGGQWRVGHLGPTGWQPLAGYAREDPLPWDEEGFSTKGYRRLFITDTGDLYGFNLANEGLFRYEGSDWESFSPTGFDNLDVGPDGTVWYDAGEEGVREDLYRFTGGEWTRWTPDDLPDIGFGTVTDSQFEVAPDGSLWSGLRRCDGLARFDGETFDPFLPGQCIWLDIAADGSVWVLAGDETLQVFSNEERKWVLADDTTSDLYVITPEAVAAKEAGVVEPPSVEEATDAEETPSTTSELLPGMDTEEVEPGVYRVINDGVRELASGDNIDLVAGHDGGIWLLRRSEYFRLGDERRPWPTGSSLAGDFDMTSDDIAWVVDFEVAPDGTAWTLTEDGDRTHSVHSSDGETWTTHEGESIDLGISPDGTVWLSLGSIRYSTDGGASWQTMDLPFELASLGTSNPERNHGRLTVVGDADLWVSPAGLFWDRGSPPVWHYLDGTWQELDEDFISLHGANRDGVLWVIADPDDWKLRRYDGAEWQEWSWKELDMHAGTGFVAADGSFWSDWSTWRSDDDSICPGISRFDGVTRQRLLPDMCGIEAIDFTDDGLVWLLTGKEEDDNATRDLYVITPEAVAGTQ